ncbi:MAG: metallopeptidase TldD-related protein [bacterium]
MGVSTLLEKTKRLGCDEVEVFREEVVERTSNGAGQEMERKSHGYAVRFLKSWRLGFACDETPESLFNTLLQRIARLEEFPVAPLSFPKFHDPKRMPLHYDSDLEREPLGARVLRLHEIGALQKASYREWIRQCTLANTHGFDLHSNGSYFELSKAGSGRHIQKRRFCDLIGAYRPDPDSISGANQISLPPRFLLAAPCAAAVLSLASHILLQKILLEEKTIASHEVTLIDDGTLPFGWGTEPVDGEGSHPERTVLIQDGERTGRIADIKTAWRMNRRPTGNCIRESFHDEPHPGFTNLVIPPSDNAVDDFLVGEREIFVIDRLDGSQVSEKEIIAVVEGNIFRFGEACEPWRAPLRVPIEGFLSVIEARFDDMSATGRYHAPSLLLHGQGMSRRITRTHHAI